MQRLLFKVVSIWVQIRDLYLYIFRHAIIVNAWIDDHTWRGLNHRNWGDDINYYFIKELSNRPVVSLFNFRLARRFRLKNYLCIGSLLGYPGYINERTIVWGAGSFGELKGVLPNHICSVRGKLTRNILVEKGIECPKVYGDPALLLPLVYNPRERFKVTNLNLSASSQSSRFKASPPAFPNREGASKKYRLGIIPHVVDLHHPVIEEIRENHADVILIIDLAHYEKWTDVIDQICSCEKVMSSSLHGLIVSDAYLVPNCWVELTGKILGGHFKFHDYASSVERRFINPIVIDTFKSITDLEQMSDVFSHADARMIQELQQGLLAVAPFQIKLSNKVNTEN